MSDLNAGTMKLQIRVNFSAEGLVYVIKTEGCSTTAVITLNFILKYCE
jgi:hypothetical protein